MYDSKIIHTKIRDSGYTPLIEQNRPLPCFARRSIKDEKKIRRFDKEEYKIYCKRSKVENVICKLKQKRRINTRYDGLLRTYKSYVYVGLLEIYKK